MSRKFSVTFHGSQGSIATVKTVQANVTAVKFARRRKAKPTGFFPGVRVKTATN